MADVKKRKEYVNVELTPDEKSEARTEIVRIMDELDMADVAKRQADAEYTKKTKASNGNIARLRMHVKFGKLTEVEVEDHFIWDLGMVKSVRTDTGEIIKERPVTKEEKQTEISTISQEIKNLGEGQ